MKRQHHLSTLSCTIAIILSGPTQSGLNREINCSGHSFSSSSSSSSHHSTIPNKGKPAEPGRAWSRREAVVGPAHATRQVRLNSAPSSCWRRREARTSPTHSPIHTSEETGQSSSLLPPPLLTGGGRRESLYST